MIQHGEAPFLEASTRGDRRFSAFGAIIAGRDFTAIEQLYQSFKEFPPGDGVGPDGHMLDWREAKGKQALNQEAAAVFYETLWRDYLAENPFLVMILVTATGISDIFGQRGRCCQATTLWKLRGEYLTKTTVAQPPADQPLSELIDTVERRW